VIDMGPEGGVKGGYVIAEGTPEHVATVEQSYTGHFLRSMLTEENYSAEYAGHYVPDKVTG
jgi:excinuclease ABC subunit A